MKRILIQLALGFILILSVSTISLTPDVRRLKKPPIELTQWLAQGETLKSIGPNQKDWMPLERVSLHLIHAVLASEDARFYSHSGLDFIEIKNSLELNWREKSYVRGASTISQQLIKLVFLSSDKTLLRKLKEALGALYLEFLFDKNSILEWYLNIVDFGQGMYGVKNAAKYYFDTEAELLTIQQATMLALVLPSPNNWSKDLESQSLTKHAKKRYKHIVDEMYKQGFITSELRDLAIATGNFGSPIDGN